MTKNKTVLLMNCNFSFIKTIYQQVMQITMKILALSLLYLLSLNGLRAQDKSDTITIDVNGQKSQIIDPETGKKTTFSFEDSTTIYQISISKFSKNGLTGLSSTPKKEEKSNHKGKSIRWFGDVSAGIVLHSGQRRESINSIIQDDLTLDFQNIGVTAPTTVVESKIDYDKINPGFRFDFQLKESRKPMGENLFLVRGMGFQYNFARATGTGTFNTYKTDSVNRIIRDSFVSGYTSKVTSNLTNYKLTFPFLIGKNIQTKGKNLTLMGGAVFGLSINSSTIKDGSGIDPKSKYSILGNFRSPFFSFQPTIKAIYADKVTFQVALDLGTQRLGFGKTQSLNSNPLAFSIGYRLY